MKRCRFCNKPIKPRRSYNWYQNQFFCHSLHYFAWRLRNKFFHRKKEKRDSYFLELDRKESAFKAYLLKQEYLHKQLENGERTTH